MDTDGERAVPTGGSSSGTPSEGGRLAPGDALVEVVRRFGPGIAADAGRCRAALSDYGVDSQAVAALGAAAQAGAAAQVGRLRPGENHEVQASRLAQSLHRQLALDSALARWAVDTWGYALNQAGVSDYSSPPDSPPPPVGSSSRSLAFPACTSPAEAERETPTWPARAGPSSSPAATQALAAPPATPPLPVPSKVRAGPAAMPARPSRVKRRRLVVAIVAVLVLGSGGATFVVLESGGRDGAAGSRPRASAPSPIGTALLNEIPAGLKPSCNPSPSETGHGNFELWCYPQRTNPDAPFKFVTFTRHSTAQSFSTERDYLRNSAATDDSDCDPARPGVVICDLQGRFFVYDGKSDSQLAWLADTATQTIVDFGADGPPALGAARAWIVANALPMSSTSTGSVATRGPTTKATR